MIARFTDRVALVTGGASGIGAAIADALAAEGAQVAVLDLTENDTPHHWIRTDVSDRASVEEAVAAVVERFGRLDIVVNNAGIGSQGNVQANDDAEWIRAWDINVVGMARVAAAALPHLRRVEGASITNTASIASTVGLPDRVLYSATKGAVAAMTPALPTPRGSDGCLTPPTTRPQSGTLWKHGSLMAASSPPKRWPTPCCTWPTLGTSPRWV